MEVSGNGTPIISQTTIAPEAEEVAPLTAALTLGAPLESSEMQLLSGFGASIMAFSSIPTYTEDSLGSDFISFSKLSEAQKWTGKDVTTVYFRKIIDGGNVYLEPLVAKRNPHASIKNLDSNILEFVSAGEPVLYTSVLPSSTDFQKLHSSEQRALTSLHGTLKTITNPSPAGGTVSYIQLDFLASESNSAATAVLSQNNKKVYIVEKLQNRDYSFMSYADQLAISKTDAFAQVKEVLGLTGTAAQAVTALDAAIDYIKHSSRFPDNASTDTFVAISGDPSVNLPGRVGYFTLEQRDLFLEQLELIRDEVLNDMAVFNMSQIQEKIDGIKARFDRALAFGNLPVRAPHIDDPSYAVYYFFKPVGNNLFNGFANLISSDDNKTVKEGFDLFIAQERAMLESAKNRRILIKNIREDNAALDAPSLLYRLQIHYNATTEAEIACASEELRQQNDLLNSYNKAQKLISTTIGFNKKCVFLDISITTDWSDEKNKEKAKEIAREFSMFQSFIYGNTQGMPPHPIEVLRSISRPRVDIYNSNGRASSKNAAEWQAAGNKMSETVSLVGQETQTSLNKVSGLEKDKARSIDMASNTLSKLNEVLISIGRSL